MKRLIGQHPWYTVPLLAAIGLSGQPVWAESDQAADSAAEQQHQASGPRSDDGGAFVYAKAGTLGVGVGAGYRITDRLAVRAGVNTGDTLGGHRTIDDLSFDRELKVGTSGELLADWRPFAGVGLRLTGGLMVLDTRSTLTARQNAEGQYIINSTAYDADDIGDLTADVRAHSVSPYIGVGWESGSIGKTGLRLFAEAGAAHLRGRRVALASSNAFEDEAFLDDIAAEALRIKRVNDFALNLSVGISLSF